MISRILITFALFAGIAYYYNIDVRAIVDKSGAPQWLAAHGIAPHQNTATTVDASTTTP